MNAYECSSMLVKACACMLLVHWEKLMPLVRAKLKYQILFPINFLKFFGNLFYGFFHRSIDNDAENNIAPTMTPKRRKNDAHIPEKRQNVLKLAQTRSEKSIENVQNNVRFRMGT